MKLNKIKRLCAETGRVDLYTRRDGRQFVSDGVGIWPVDDKLHLSEGSIRAIFDVPYEKWESDWHYQEFDYALDADAETSGIPETLLDDIAEPGTEIKVIPMHDRAITGWGEMQLYREMDGERCLWCPKAQMAAAPSMVSYFAVREYQGSRRALAVYENMLMGALILVPGQGMQKGIMDWLKDLSGKEVM